MTEIFKSYTKTIQKLLLRYDRDLSSAFIDNNIEEIWQSHDNWNGGIDTYLIKLYLPLEVYYRLKDSDKISEAESKIASYYEDILKGDDSIVLSGVAISPNDNSQIGFGTNNNDSVWKPGYFRLFISHVSKYKNSASHLKNALGSYGIDCFVAHEDITPSKEWETEIESALFTMDALCAIVVPEFTYSLWCDQEVGIALGRQKLVLSINKGAYPYGFFGKFQALKSKDKAREMAIEVWRAISSNEHTMDIYSEKLINLILNVKSANDGKIFLDVITAFDNINKRYIEYLHRHYSENDLLIDAHNLSLANQIFKQYGLTEIELKTVTTINTANDDDLPF